MEIIFFWNSTGISPWSAYFQYLLCHLFYFLEGVAVASYAHDTTPYTANKTNNLVLKETEHFSEVLFKWFDFNYMKIYSGKSHYYSQEMTT